MIMSIKITTICKLIESYYNVCDSKDYHKEFTASDIISHRSSIINVIYLEMYGKLPHRTDTFTLLRVLNNDISGKRLTPKQIIERFKIKE